MLVPPPDPGVRVEDDHGNVGLPVGEERCDQFLVVDTRYVTLPSSDSRRRERREPRHRLAALRDDDRLAALGDLVEELRGTAP